MRIVALFSVKIPNRLWMGRECPQPTATVLVDVACAVLWPNKVVLENATHFRFEVRRAVLREGFVFQQPSAFRMGKAEQELAQGGFGIVGFFQLGLPKFCGIVLIRRRYGEHVERCPARLTRCFAAK